MNPKTSILPEIAKSTKAYHEMTPQERGDQDYLDDIIADGMDDDNDDY